MFFSHEYSFSISRQRKKSSNFVEILALQVYQNAKQKMNYQLSFRCYLKTLKSQWNDKPISTKQF